MPRNARDNRPTTFVCGPRHGPALPTRRVRPSGAASHLDPSHRSSRVSPTRSAKTAPPCPRRSSLARPFLQEELGRAPAACGRAAHRGAEPGRGRPHHAVPDPPRRLGHPEHLHGEPGRCRRLAPARRGAPPRHARGRDRGPARHHRLHRLALLLRAGPGPCGGGGRVPLPRHGGALSAAARRHDVCPRDALARRVSRGLCRRGAVARRRDRDGRRPRHRRAALPVARRSHRQAPRRAGPPPAPGAIARRSGHRAAGDRAGPAIGGDADARRPDDGAAAPRQCRSAPRVAPSPPRRAHRAHPRGRAALHLGALGGRDDAGNDGTGRARRRRPRAAPGDQRGERAVGPRAREPARAARLDRPDGHHPGRGRERARPSLPRHPSSTGWSARSAGSHS